MGPARVAYLIQIGSEQGFRRAAEEACTRWGGATEPIVPVRTKGRIDRFWSQVVELSNVDGLVNIDVGREDAKVAADRLGMACVELRDIDRSGAGQFTCNPAAVADPSPLPPWVYGDPSLDLWAVGAGRSLPNQAIVDVRSLNHHLVPTNFPDQLARSQISGRTAIDRTVSQFGEWSQAPGTWPHAAIVWVCGRRAFRDCVMYWNCRALRSLSFFPVPMLLIPEYEIDHWTHFGAQVLSLFESTLIAGSTTSAAG